MDRGQAASWRRSWEGLLACEPQSDSREPTFRLGNAFPSPCSLSSRIVKYFKVFKQPAICIFIYQSGGFLIFSNNNFTLKKDFILEAPKNLGAGRGTE